MSTSNLPIPSAPGQPVVAISPGETSSSAIAAREKAAVEARFVVAINRPRDFETSRRRLMDACRRPAFAAVARYSKPVGRERITGLSVRFAEEARILWGNLDVSAFIVFDDDEKRIYRVQGTDLETNANEGVDIIVEKYVERRVVRDGMEVIGQRTNTTGQTVYRVRATEDDLVVKVNAQLSKARRNTILALISADVKDQCETQIMATLADADAKDPSAARQQLLDAFWKYAVTPAQVAELLGHPVELMSLAELSLLRSYGTALKDGEATWQEIFEAHTAGKTPKAAGGATPATSKKGTEGLKSALKKDDQSTTAATASIETVTPKNICSVCAGVDGNHSPECRFYAD